ncbi:hypothetical protein [Amycolatopsis sp. GM8]|uniref:arsenate reductase/protein-tyrosine-phosphatase family protein n=1 Tax=Amycolatopsis sp. GM8 TaxID=2896530 RepID=UPI001F2DC86D|nr:hypothetical protein [Amycolatopsis sp. GM8]
MSDRETTGAFRILFVGTTNVSRSPIAELLARQLLRTALGAVVSRFAVSSAGTEAAPGTPMDHRAVRVLASRGLDDDARAFQSTRLSGRQIRGADLVLTATRRQGAAVLALEPGARGRTFCMLELVRLLPMIDALRLPRDPLIRARAAAESGRELRAAGAHRTPESDDIPDPARLSDYGYSVSVALVESAVYRFVKFLKPASNPPEVPA